MLGLITAGVMGTVALISIATMTRPGRHKEFRPLSSLGTAELWTQQNKTDSETVNEIADLRRAVIL